MSRLTPLVFNSLTRTKVPFPKERVLTFYVCGPTVYDAAHIGHGRTYTLFDAMRRVLRNVFGKEVIYAMNITDIDDKILKRCAESKVSREELTRRHENEFFADMAKLGNERPLIVPRATEYIQEMVDFIGDLTKKGFAYRTSDGSVYLDTKAAHSTVGYPGVLGAGRTVDDVDHSEKHSEKKNVSDFALWKGAKNELRKDLWDAEPWGGLGRPGWHLECSAMINATLGHVSGDGTLDVHGGGIDLCFPHHENERCQSQLHLGPEKQWAKVFCHSGHVTVDSVKMSKSLGNFSTLRDIMNSKEINARQLRLLFLSSSRYSSSLEWNQGSIDKAKALDAQIENALKVINRNSHQQREILDQEDVRFISDIAQSRETIENALADDFDFPKVFEEIQKVCKAINRRSTQPRKNNLDEQARLLVTETMETLGFGGRSGVQPAYGHVSIGASPTSDNADEILDLLVQFRAKVRNFAKAGDSKGILQACDVVRNNNPFISIQDMKDGTSVWKRKA